MGKYKNKGFPKIRWSLMAYDTVIMLCLFVLILGHYVSRTGNSMLLLVQPVLIFALTNVSRLIFKINSQVWRYGGIQSYIKLLCSDACAFLIHFAANRLLLPGEFRIPVETEISVFSLDLLAVLSIRMVYRYAYKFGNQQNSLGKILRTVLKIASFGSINPISIPGNKQIKVAIIGAGSVGINLAEELLQNTSSAYVPVCFIDTDKEKIGREIHYLPVLPESDAAIADLEQYGVQEVIFAFPAASGEKRKELYDYYSNAGYKIKVYDYPSVENATGKKRHLREFDPEELLFRKSIDIINGSTRDFYKDKVILITGGGGSIGSELCRQIAKMSPRQIIILDIYENGAYDVQQELRIKYGKEIDIRVEIVSVTNKKSFEKVFEEYHPDIVLNAAAHKHVPLMEKNCIEAIENNVFGTLNTVELCEQYGVKRMIMVSTDKAVNPTNVMGATKRMCEMIVQAHSAVSESTTFSTTRFGNVLGSAGSVIPLFKKQIAVGGPITITDKRIIRYFMTIPEASQLVLTSGAMAKNGELFVLDMGSPVKILDLAINMIRLSGMVPYKDIEIVETGLRPGEKLYEELLVKSENLDKTDNELIFVERDAPYSIEEIEEKLNILRAACETRSDEEARLALMSVVPTFRKPEEVNAEAEKQREMQMANT